jgi:RNA polymerase sigma factor (TIGR02999 family)
VHDVTTILQAIKRGDKKAADDLLPLVYDELRKLAAARLAKEGSEYTLQATALVHEAWIKLSGNQEGWNSRGHYFGAAAEAMRRILIDRARKRSRVRHGAGLQRVNFDSVDFAMTTDNATLLELDEALRKFALESPDKAKLVELRFFAGLKLKEAAEALEPV